MNNNKVFSLTLGIVKIIVILLSLSIEISLMFYFYGVVSEVFRILYWFEHQLIFLLVLYIVHKNERVDFKLGWIVFLTFLPSTGFFFYLFVGRKSFSKQEKETFFTTELKGKKYLEKNDEIINSIDNPIAKQQLQMINNLSGYVPYSNTSVEYYPVGEKFHKSLINELKKAEKFIFMQYYIVSAGKMHDEIMEVLVDRVKAGVEIYYMHDSAGSLAVLPKDFYSKCEEYGIKVKAFNNRKHRLYHYASFRDHRKITVIDNKVAFTGGINIGDEYINDKERFGHWKDMAVKLEGEAVKSLTLIALKTWEYETKKEMDFDKYIFEKYSVDSNTIVCPFDDGPMTNDDPAENTFIRMITGAKESIYIATPYLILTTRIIDALVLASESGVDVNIITPHIPDKKLVFRITRSFYIDLLRKGVKVYEYTPGFVHGKTIVVDGETAVVGTINFDYRSLAWNFECGAWIHGKEAVKPIEDDLLTTIKISQQRTIDEHFNMNWLWRFGNSLLKLFSPLL